jgi:hypothetical protein
MLCYILFQLKIISARNLLRGLLPKGSYGRYLWVQRSSECIGIGKHVLHNKQADVKIVANGIKNLLL